MGFLGNGISDATLYLARLFGSSASVRSNASSGDKGSGKAPSSFAASGVSSGEGLSKELQVAACADSVKIFIHSLYDCLLAVKRDLADRFSWLESRARYEEAWSLIDEHPEAASAFNERTESTFEPSAKPQGTPEESFADDSVSVNIVGHIRLQDAEAGMSLMRDYRPDAVSDNIPGFIFLHVSKEQMKTATVSELNAEPIQILVREAYNGFVRPETVVAQLQSANLHL